MIRAALALVVTSFLASSSASAIDSFQKVSPGIYRGARPGSEGMEFLASLGIRTILNLENIQSAVSEEAKIAKEYGIRHVSESMSAFWKPSDVQVRRILALVADPDSYPLYIHCHYGQDRTGLIVGLHRVFEEGWSPDEAYEEMLEIGFHPELVNLQRYFDEKTGHEALARPLLPSGI